MAGWQDGSEYAPREAPAGFATPRVEPLRTAVAATVVDPVPLSPPATFEPPAHRGPDLAGLQPAAHLPRNPREPFEARHHVVEEPFDPTQPFSTASRNLPGSGWGTANDDPSPSFVGQPGAPGAFPPPSGEPAGPGALPARRSPTLPLQQAAERHVAQRTLVESGPPGQAAPAGAPPSQRWQASTGMPGPTTQWAPLPATPLSLGYFGQLLNALGWPMLACLTAGALLEPLAPTLLVCAWLFSTQARVPQGWIRWLFRLVVVAVVALTALMTLNGSYTPYPDAQLWSRWGCLLLLVALPVGTLIRTRRPMRHPDQ